MGLYGGLSVAVVFLSCIFFFFFQAEDGIRDVERSRGLGDVYKRQVSTQSTWGNSNSKETVKLGYVNWAEGIAMTNLSAVILEDKMGYQVDMKPVSYTHLTLPTILLVQISVVAVSLKKKKQTLQNYDVTTQST
eukprot:TRINITY_DN51815_c0_g1_i2.p2 TRINITY_DN51815_c0_g1~~TRINITY_DN51815_c0_g1_i2.p2  ORF type:complete len:134 (+),score=41.03 TRINITY_DN51815_c0_g1_i2:67-468(+)